MWEELGVSAGTGMIVLIALYFVIKWAVKSAIAESYEELLAEKDDTEEYAEGYAPEG